MLVLPNLFAVCTPLVHLFTCSDSYKEFAARDGGENGGTLLAGFIIFVM